MTPPGSTILSGVSASGLRALVALSSCIIISMHDSDFVYGLLLPVNVRFIYKSWCFNLRGVPESGDSAWKWYDGPFCDCDHRDEANEVIFMRSLFFLCL